MVCEGYTVEYLGFSMLFTQTMSRFKVMLKEENSASSSF